MQALIDRIETLIHRDVGRGMDAVFRATRGGLRQRRVGPGRFAGPADRPDHRLLRAGADPPAAETDGPAGAALMARGFIQSGLSAGWQPTRSVSPLAARRWTRPAPAMVPIDAVAPGGTVEALVDLWRRDGIDWVIAIERCGPAADGHPRNMRGADISAHVAPLDRLFSAGPWQTIGIGDGGNEIGMGRVPAARYVPLGETIGCVVPADFLIAAGVSHWGAYALLAALAVLRPDWSAAMLSGLDPALDPELDRAVIEAMVRDGPAVDGVSLRREGTIDALEMTVHQAMMEAVRNVAGR